MRNAGIKTDCMMTISTLETFEKTLLSNWHLMKARECGTYSFRMFLPKASWLAYEVHANYGLLKHAVFLLQHHKDVSNLGTVSLVLLLH